MSKKQTNIAYFSSINNKLSAVIYNHNNHLHSLRVSELFRHYKKCDFMYFIDMNTYFLLLFNYYIFVTYAHFLITYNFNKLNDCWIHLAQCYRFPSETHIISKGKSDILDF